MTTAVPECMHCGEPVLPDDPPSGIQGGPLHWECGLRLGIGSLAHVERRCSCYIADSIEGDPEDLSPREAARAAVRAYYAERA